WDAVLDAGATPFGLDAIELLRVEAGLLIQYEDYTPGETDPYELNLNPYIEFEGHDFVGREAAKKRAADRPRRFATLRLDGDAPESGARVNQGATDVGDVRSSFSTPRFGTIALAVLDAEAARESEHVEVEGARATVGRVPIDDPGKLRPRSDPRSPVTIDSPGQTA
ncbi:MAG: hypothetical protein M3O84_03945, partial [Actinomycetota bacterium]|nr:hypothetical protein [Actinomycetota bacterium]